MTRSAIQVENISKLYRIGVQESRPENLVQAVAGWATAPLRNFRRLRGRTHFESTGYEDSADTIWALRGVSFDVQPGESVGIIGRNGAGKSTMLKILSRITEPTNGRAVINGRVASLLEVGTGFHPELTGRENVYLNATILGMRKAEVDRKFDEIVNFSGVEKFIDTPVKFYSSGMKVRLAFAVAAHLEPEILIVDEVLAVGDAEFQKKCLGKMGEVASGGRTVLFVSHSMAAVENLCQRVLLFDGGRIIADGDTNTTIRKYATLLNHNMGERDLRDPAVERIGSGQVVFEKVEVSSSDGQNISGIPVGGDVTVKLHVRAIADIDNAALLIELFTAQGLRLSGYNSRTLHNVTFELQEGTRAVLGFTMQRLNLAPGLYKLNVSIRDRYQHFVDRVEDAIAFEVIASDFFGSGRLPGGSNLVYFDASWSMNDQKLEYAPSLSPLDVQADLDVNGGEPSKMAWI
jgi:lipopolysaccharide transport system ATP-binding protein